VKPIVLFGVGPLASLLRDYLSQQKGARVAGFTADKKYLSSAEYCGLPAVPFEKVEHRFPPGRFDLLVGVGYSKMNRVRAEKCRQAKAKGYRLASFIHPTTTRWKGFAPGENSVILENNVFQPHSEIGNNVCVWSGCLISHHTVLGDNVFLAPGAVLCGQVRVGDNCFIGANATIRNGVRVAPNCVIGAGAVILEDTRENGVYRAPAARKLGIKSHDLKFS